LIHRRRALGGAAAAVIYRRKTLGASVPKESD
jgi:hypothetical protein